MPKSPATMDVGVAARGELDGRQGHEIPPALIGQDGDVAGEDVGDRQVDAAVVLEVALGDRDGALPDRDRRQDRNVPSPLPRSTW